MQKQITLVAAIGKNRGIGFDGRMPWHLPAELQHFKRVTMGHAILMGRKTWQAVGRPLPGRQNIVATRNPDFVAVGADVCTSLDEAMEISRHQEIMVIGGGQLYELTMPLAQRMVLSLVDTEASADTWFPCWSDSEWRQVSEQCFKADDNNPHAYQVVELLRIKSDPIHSQPGTMTGPQV